LTAIKIFREVLLLDPGNIDAIDRELLSFTR